MTKSRTSRWILPILALAALGYFGWQRFHGPDATAKTESAPSSSARTAVRVTIAPAEKADFPFYLTGLGTVQWFNTVVVRPGVDGQMERTGFKEGRLANQRDRPPQINPRPNK